MNLCFFFNSVWKETFLNLEMLPFQENMVKDITIRFKEIMFFFNYYINLCFILSSFIQVKYVTASRNYLRHE